MFIHLINNIYFKLSIETNVLKEIIINELIYDVYYCILNSKNKKNEILL